MTTPTENPTCKHCGQSKFNHYPQPSMLGLRILVCPFATFEAETEPNLSGGVEGHAHSLRDRVSANQWGSSGKETGNPMPSRLSPAQNLSRAWIPVSTPPTEQDADDDGFVRWLFTDGTRSHRPWDKNWKDHNYSPPTHWHSLPKLQQPDPDADEAEFEAWASNKAGIHPDGNPEWRELARKVWIAAANRKPRL